MIKMIAYISTPYAPESLATQNEAIIQLNKAIGKFTRANANYTCVNALYSVYKNPFLNGPFGRKDVFTTVKPLMDSASILIILMNKGWEHCDIVMNEAAYAAASGKKIAYMEIKQEQIND